MNYDQQASIVREILRAHPAPYKSLKWRLTPDLEDTVGFAWVLRFYLDNFASHTDHQQLIIVEWADTILKKINSAGVPCGVERVNDNEVFGV